MNPDIKAAWIAALRSGDYSQTRCVLQNSEGYCCLGVLCELHENATSSSLWDRTEETEFLYDSTSGLLPKSVVEWAGFQEGCLGKTDDGYDVLLPSIFSFRRSSLSYLNDSCRDFKEIADCIEDYIPANPA